MGLRFRKSINLGGGARLNISKSGIGYSMGTKGFRATKTSRGSIRTTASIPGTGISYVSERSAGGLLGDVLTVVAPFTDAQKNYLVINADEKTIRLNSDAYQYIRGWAKIDKAKTRKIVWRVLLALLCVVNTIISFVLAINLVKAEITSTIMIIGMAAIFATLPIYLILLTDKHYDRKIVRLHSELKKPKYRANYTNEQLEKFEKMVKALQLLSTSRYISGEILTDGRGLPPERHITFNYSSSEILETNANAVQIYFNDSPNYEVIVLPDIILLAQRYLMTYKFNVIRLTPDCFDFRELYSQHYEHENKDGSRDMRYKTNYMYRVYSRSKFTIRDGNFELISINSRDKDKATECWNLIQEYLNNSTSFPI